VIGASDAAGTVGAYAADMLNNVAAGWSGPPVRALPPERPTFSAVLDCFDTGVVLLGEHGEIVHANAAIRALEKLGVFALGQRSLVFTERRAAETFASRLSAREADEAPFVARDSSGTHAIVFRVIASSDGQIRRSGTIVLATDPDSRTVVDRRLFEIALGLSRAEAVVAVALLEGLDAKAVSARLHVSHETVRTHLKRIFEKTRTRRQAELLLVLLQIARLGVYPFEVSRISRS
jgi:DNA-binding CsgD family transcriptional regulator